MAKATEIKAKAIEALSESEEIKNASTSVKDAFAKILIADAIQNLGEQIQDDSLNWKEIYALVKALTQTYEAFATEEESEEETEEPKKPEPAKGKKK
jgi:hypothetical protein